MNWVDLAILLVIGFFIFEGFTRGFVNETLDFLVFLLSFALSLRFYNFVAGFYQSNFQIPYSLSTVLGFITVWFLVEAILFTLIRVAFSRTNIINKIDKLFYPITFIPAFLRGLIFVTIILLMIGTFPIQPRIKLEVDESKVGSVMLNQARRLETPLKNVFGGITQDALSFLTIKPRSDETVGLGFKTSDYVINEQLEFRMIELVNEERAKKGVNKLTFDANLREVGRVHSKDMLERGYFSHYSPEGNNVADRADKLEVRYLVIGENLAYAPSLDLAHNGLMNSEGHRANILSNDYNKIGIGIMQSRIYGLMITQIFSN